MLTEEKIDNMLVKYAKKEGGWAETKIQLAARILWIIREDCTDKTMRIKLKEVVDYLQNLQVEKYID